MATNSNSPTEPAPDYYDRRRDRERRQIHSMVNMAALLMGARRASELGAEELAAMSKVAVAAGDAVIAAVDSSFPDLEPAADLHDMLDRVIAVHARETKRGLDVTLSEVLDWSAARMRAERGRR